MTAENFAYWLKGYFEINEADLIPGTVLVLSEAQIKMIKQHLDYVFQPMTVIPNGTLVTTPGQTGGVISTIEDPESPLSKALRGLSTDITKASYC